MLTSLRLPVALAALAMTACGPSGPATLEFVDITPAQPRIGEITTIKFKATDYRGEPQAGTTVKFHLLADKPGVTLTPATGTTEKGTGEVSVQLITSARVTSVTIVADAGGKLAYSPPLSFAGSVPNGRQFTFQCGPFGGPGSGGVHAIHVFDESRNMIAGSRVFCTAHVGDRNSDGVPDALVSFIAEAGTIGPTATSMADVLGNATVLYKSSLPMPRETDPSVFSWNPVKGDRQTGEYVAPLWMHPYEWLANPIASLGQPATLQEPRRKDPVRKSVPQPTNNPRDNLVTMIAVTSGEEGFTDVNNNGKYDDGEPFDDLTEPFVDSNDDGTWDAEEKFVDVNGNGVWDGRNGQWDSNALIWVEERITWTGTPATEDMQDTVAPVFRAVGFVPDTGCAPSTLHPCIPMLGGVSASFVMSDPWFNGIAQNGESDGCEMSSPDDKPPVVASPRKANAGRMFTYPSVTGFTVNVKDARDPNAPPLSQVPVRAPPIHWSTPLTCSFTSSPEQGFVTVIALDTVEGYVE